MELVDRLPVGNRGWRPDYAAPERMSLVELEVKPGRHSWEDYFRLPSNLDSSGFINVLESTPDRFSVYIDRALVNVVASLAPRALFTYTDVSRVFFVDAHLAPLPPEPEPPRVYPTSVPHVGTDGLTTLEPTLQQWTMKASVNLAPPAPQFGVAYRFHTFYHPYVCDFIRALASKGIDGLLRWSQQSPEPLQEKENDYFLNTYQPTEFVHPVYPLDNVDFSFRGAYGHYNWELFFHAPLLIATRLTQNGRYEEADRWYRTIFDPTGGAPGTGPERFWFVRPFRDILSVANLHANLDTLATTNPEASLIKNLLEAHFADPVVEEMIAMTIAWLENPSDPHRIARSQPYAYQKAVVMKYIDHLLQWGDSLFRRETIEAINEATQIYILAQNILGKRPRIVPTKKTTALTYQELIANAAAHSGPLVEVESLIPPLPDAEPLPPIEEPPIVMATYFCLPVNENLLRLWDTVEDRLFKLRHCMDIDGNVRQLPLFEPPIDPALLVRAAAAGLDIGTVLAELNAPLPLYRFSVLLPKAMDFVGSVIAMGTTLLSILEKRDGETLAKMRATQEINLLTSIRNVRQRQIDEAKETLEGLRRSRAVVEERHKYYASIEQRNDSERQQESLTIAALILNSAAVVANGAAGVLALIPQMQVTAGLPPSVSVEFGGKQLSKVLEIGAAVFSGTANALSMGAGMAATNASIERRWDEWKHQEKLAGLELNQIDKQILAGEIRLDIAQKELQNHELSLTNAKEVEAFLRTKFTSEELYVWLLGRAREVYFQGYKLAYDMAKRAERTFQFELASVDTFVKADHWNGGKQGLMAGERLQLDLRRMDAAYIEQNRREYEITKHISLAEVDPIELMKLRGGGKCTADLKEGHFDQDWPGHYLRRIKSVSLTVPVTNAPYGSVNCGLAISSNRVRQEAGGTRQESELRTDYIRTESIVTSTGQQDSGLFELVFRDERYLPFEGLGAISTWDVTLKKEGNRFDPATIHDVVMHMRYMARHNGSSASVASGLTNYRLFSARTDFPNEWNAFIEGTNLPVVHELHLPLAMRHFQPVLGNDPQEITRIHLFARRVGNGTGSLTITVHKPTGGTALEPELGADPDNYGKILRKEEIAINGAVPILDDTVNNVTPWKLTVPTSELALVDIWLVCEYT
jgi:Tc toxin complex TcA C-terminal TcB-binding domain